MSSNSPTYFAVPSKFKLDGGSQDLHLHNALTPMFLVLSICNRDADVHELFDAQRKKPPIGLLARAKHARLWFDSKGDPVKLPSRFPRQKRTFVVRFSVTRRIQVQECSLRPAWQ